MRIGDQGREIDEESNDIDKVTSEGEPLRGDEPDVPLPDEKKIRVRAKAEHTSEIEKKKRRHQRQDIDLLITPEDGVKPRAHHSRTIRLARLDHAQIVDEKQPDEDRVDRAEFEPSARIRQMGEEKRFTHGAADVEEIVWKLQRPPDEGESVDD